MTKKKKYMAIIRIMAGSSWGYGDTPEKAVRQAKEVLDRDWRDYRNPSDPASFVVYLAPECGGWYADDTGIYADDGTGTKLVRYGLAKSVTATKIEWEK